MTPKYYVSLGGINLHQVNSFELTSSRDIETYDGIGSGRFNVPDAHDPREWTINCQLLQDGGKLSGLNTWSASELFKAFESWLEKTDAPIRMVKTDLIYPAANISALVWFKSYHPKEADDQGQYDTEIVVTEYKPVGIKTTGIPTVSRPGKMPVPPKVTITKKNTVYQTHRKTGAGTYYDATAINSRNKNHNDASALKNPQTGKYLKNAASVVTPSAWNVGTIKGGHIWSTTAEEEMASTPANNPSTAVFELQKTFSSIGNSIKNFFLGFR